MSLDIREGLQQNKVTENEWKTQLKSFFDDKIDTQFLKLEKEIKADENIRDKEIMRNMTENLCKETKSLGLMRISFCLHIMSRSVNNYQMLLGLYPILRVEQNNTEYMVRMLLGEP
jgi:hypothetical protein